MSEVPEKTPDITEDELLEVLKQIVRDGGNAAARIAAVRTLRAWRADEKPAGGFEELDELAPRRGMRTKKGPHAA